MASNGNNDSRPRCKCKKTECLKLYCDCFADEYYCGGDCSCKECHNLREYEDSVEEARDKIKQRDPLAFAPKIHPVVQPPTNHNEGGDQLRPVVRKHRKGCTCKNSKCSQMYCECYKANVGCSGGCRCEGCLNRYGKRGDYMVYNPPHIVRPINEIPRVCENKELEYTSMKISPPQSFYSQSLTPWTTPTQYPGHVNGTSTTRNYIASPGSANNHITMIGTSRTELAMVPFGPPSYPNNVDQTTNNGFTHQEVNEINGLNPNGTLTDNNTPEDK